MRGCMQTFMCGILLFLGLVPSLAQTDTIPRSTTPNLFTVLRSGAWEEHHIVRYLPPCRVVGLRIFYLAETAGPDTIHITSTSRLVPVPPVAEHWTRAAITAPVVVTVTRDTQTIDVDLRSRNIQLHGYEALVLSHTTNDNDRYWASRTGPYVYSAIDTATASVAVDRNSAVPRFVQVTQRYSIQVIVEHDYGIPATRVRPQSGSMLAEYNSVAAWEYGSNNASVADFNNDGFDDVIFDSLLTLNRSAGALQLQTVFLNSKDSGFTADISAWCDFDRDGDLDCIIFNRVTQEIRLMRTDTTAKFTDITTGSGIAATGNTTALLWFDADNDGDADIFAGREQQDMLWLNDGSGRFTDATVSSGLAASEPAPYDTCGSASLGDINADGNTDIIVVTRGTQPDRLMVNDGTGKFSTVSAPSRIGSISTGSHGNGEGAEWGDFNDDGIDDILVANALRIQHPDRLQDGSVVWRTKSRAALLFDTLWSDLGLPFVGSTNGYTAADVNLDGLPDLVGIVPDTTLSIADRAYVTVLTRQFSSGRRIFNHNSFAFGLPVVDVGFALRTDIDMDGDQDFIVNRTSVLRNNMSNANNGVTIRLHNKDLSSVTQDCFGSLVQVYAGGTSKSMYFPGTICSGRGSTSSSAMTFGLGASTKADSVVVVYNNKSKRTYKDIAANGGYILGTDGSVERIAGPPRQQAPIFNAIDVSSTPLFEWSTMGAGVTYDLQVFARTNITSPVRDLKGLVSTSHNLALALPTALEYQWRVRAHFADGKVSQWSTPWPLTVGRVVPGIVYLQSPPNRSPLYLPDVVLRWAHSNDSRQINAAAVYSAEVAVDSNFSSIVASRTVDAKYVEFTALQPGTKYFWRVRAVLDGVNGPWSAVWTFTTKAFPSKIELIAPYLGEENVYAKTQLRWREPDGLDPNFLATYLMHFGLDSLCTDILDTGTSGDTIEPGQYLLLNQKYFWRVRLVTAFGNGPWSDIWWFKTGWIISNVDEHATSGPRTTHLQVTPLPFGDRVSIGLPIGSSAHIRVHDMHGTLLDEREVASPETNWVDLNARGWPSGPVIISAECNGQWYRTMSVHLP